MGKRDKIEKARKRLAKKLKKTTKELANAQDSEVTREALERRAEKLERKLEKARRNKERVIGKSSGNVPERIFDYTQNREVSWLRFDDRVLDEAFDQTVPLFERLKFVSIFGSNLDEWFMVRIGGLSDLALLKKQPRDIRSNETPSEQIEHVLAMLPALVERQGQVFNSIEANLAGHGLTRVSANDLTDEDLRRIARHFDTRIAPIMSPMIIDPRHPFPNLKNGRLYVACSLDGPDESGLLGVVEVPHTLDRVFPLPSTSRNYRYILLEDIMLFRLGDCFGDYAPTSSAVIRVTRNADIDPDGEGVEEEEDYRQHMKAVLRKRLRLQAVRLEVDGTLDEGLLDFVRDSLHLTPNRVFHTKIPLDLGYVFGLEDHIPEFSQQELLCEPFEPQPSPMVDASRPMREQVEDHDILLCYPYESMDPLLRLLREAANDTNCISIKITLYRVAKQSKLCESLIAAVENGKEVTVLMELRARFDEANNIAWADRLELAGCTVIYGFEGFKVHSKICQITYHDGGAIRRITCLGTGNFNEKTARLYSDFMLLTAHEQIGEDGSTFFRNLSLGNLRGTYRHLGVAPVGLKPLVMRGLNREIERARNGEAARVFMKMNSLTDRDVIDKIAEACQAGVTVVLIVRGICCIRADIEGYTEGLIIRQIVGRFLEHTRIYAFGADSDIVYLSSADMMTRNTEHRVEIAYPVLDDVCRKLVVQFVNIQLADNVKARQLTSEGTWAKVDPEPGEPTINAQELLMAIAYRRGKGELVEGANILLSDYIHVDLPPELMGKLAALPSMTHVDESLLEELKSASTDATAAEAQVVEADDEPADAVANETGQQDAETGVDTPGGAAATEPEPVIAQEERPDAKAPATSNVPEKREPVATQRDASTTVPDESGVASAQTSSTKQDGASAQEPSPATKATPVQEAVDEHQAEAKPTAEAPEVVFEADVDEPGPTATRQPPQQEPRRRSEGAIEPRRPNRLSVAFKLITMGIGELFTGKISRNAKKRR